MIPKIVRHFMAIEKPQGQGYPSDRYITDLARISYGSKAEYQVFADELINYEPNVLHFVIANERIKKVFDHVEKRIFGLLDDKQKRIQLKRLSQIQEDWKEQLRSLLVVDINSLHLEDEISMNQFHEQIEFMLVEHTLTYIFFKDYKEIDFKKNKVVGKEVYDLLVSDVDSYSSLMRFLIFSRLLDSRPLVGLTLFQPSEDETEKIEMMKEWLQSKEKFHGYHDVFSNQMTLCSVNEQLKEFVKYIGNLYFPRKDYRFLSFIAENECNEEIRERAFIEVFNHKEFRLKDALEPYDQENVSYYREIYDFLYKGWESQDLLEQFYNNLANEAHDLSSALFRKLVLDLEEKEWLLLFHPTQVLQKLGKNYEPFWQAILEDILTSWDNFENEYAKRTFCVYWEYLFLNNAMSHQVINKSFIDYFLAGGNDTEVRQELEHVINQKVEEVFASSLSVEKKSKILEVLGYHLIGSIDDLNACVSDHPSWFDFENAVVPMEHVQWSYSLVKYGLSKKGENYARVRAVIRADIENDDLLNEMLNELENI